jgi:long-chain acyl-CoA synthetase
LKLDWQLENIWLENYPAGVSDPEIFKFGTLVDLIEHGFARHKDACAYKFRGEKYSFRQIDEASRAFAGFLQGQGLKQGDRVAVMMPNTPQYPVVVAAILRAGMVVVNVNPLYTARELKHQLRDSGARMIVILENFATTLQACLPSIPTDQIVLTSLGDLLKFPQRQLVNAVVRHLKPKVKKYRLPGAIAFRRALALGAKKPMKNVSVSPDDLAVLQYTGGTTGVSKGVMLQHKNLVANATQAEAWCHPALDQVPQGEQVQVVCALPLSHSFAFTCCMFFSILYGACNILIPNPRDTRSLLKVLAKEKFHYFPAVNTLFASLLKHPDFDQVDWRHLRLSLGGGMAVLQATADEWRQRTGCAIAEGYGLSETTCCATCNPLDGSGRPGSVGLPLPFTEVVVVDANDLEVPPGEPGEIWIRGPQVMKGYWHKIEATRDAMTSDRFFRTGDIGTMDEKGYVTLIDRKKDMILVSGFNVYPSEIESVVSQMPGVLECAACSIPDEKSGEAVKLFVVPDDGRLTEKEIEAVCKRNLAVYKQPKVIEFIDELPKSMVGKVLRRELQERHAEAEV